MLQLMLYNSDHTVYYTTQPMNIPELVPEFMCMSYYSNNIANYCINYLHNFYIYVI